MWHSLEDVAIAEVEEDVIATELGLIAAENVLERENTQTFILQIRHLPLPSPPFHSYTTQPAALACSI